MIDEYIRTMKRHDTGEAVRAQIINNSNGLPADLTGVIVRFHMYKVNTSTGALEELVNEPGAVEVPETDGVIRYTWHAGDTEEAGKHLASFEIEYPSGEKETYPRKGYMDIHIEQDLEDQ